ncbi:MAG: GNAT family protein [Pseudomonadota bacterium]
MKDTRQTAERIDLIEFAREDIPRLIGWIRSPEDLSAWAGAFFTYPLDEAKLERYLSSGQGEQPERRIFKAVDAESGEAVGHIELSHIWPYLSARMSRVLVGDPSLRGRGVGTRIVRALLQQAFAEYSFGHIDLGVNAANRRAIACYRRAGFAHVGTWPKALKTPAGVIDVYWMSITRAAASSSR